MSSLIVFVCFQDRLLWSACLLWSLAMSIVRFIWKLSAVLCDNHIAAYMVLARSDLQAFGILQTEHAICNARCMTIWYLLFGKRTFILRGKQNENINGKLLDAFTKLFFSISRWCSYSVIIGLWLQSSNKSDTSVKNYNKFLCEVWEKYNTMAIWWI